MTMRGHWPGRVELRKGWARADARPWNAATPAAHLRLVRGSAGFLAEAAHQMLGPSVVAVLSSPVLGSARLWEEAGFASLVDLVLMRGGASMPPAPLHNVEPLGAEHREAALAVDGAAFRAFWRIDAAGLDEALDATARSVLLGVRDPSGILAGFAVVGVTGRMGYLQRAAVDPARQGRGVGRSLTRASARWARSHGADALLLNTQPGNTTALGLYESEGFERLPDRLAVYAYPLEAATSLPEA